ARRGGHGPGRHPRRDRGGRSGHRARPQPPPPARDRPRVDPAPPHHPPPPRPAPLRAAVLESTHPASTLLATAPNIEKALGFADLVLGAVAVRGERAPRLVTREMLRLMKPRRVVMDLSIDMGGCFETSRPTAFPDPTYEV